MNPIVTQSPRRGDFLLSHASGQRSFANGYVNARAGVVLAGTIMALLTASNAAVATAGGSNTGNGTMGTITVANEAITGTYTLTITKATANSGDFELVDPNGDVVGKGQVGVAFSGGGLSFTLADGSTDFAKNDLFTIAVSAGIGEWVPYDDDGNNDGRRAATGILYGSVDASEQDVLATFVVRDAEVDESLLIGFDEAARADLTALGIIVR